MTDITIPPEALEAGMRVMQNNLFCNLTDAEHLSRAAFLAMIEAWPGKDIVGYGPPFYGIDLILPLPQEITLNAQNINALDVKSTREGISDDE